MQRKPSASLEFIDKPVEQKPPFGENVATLMTANPIAPSPPHNVAAMNTANSELATAISGAEGGDVNRMAIRDAKEVAWNDIFRDNANYITTVSAGDKVKITSTGFKATVTETTPVPIPEVAKEADFTTNQPKGSIHAQTEAIENTVGYISILSTAGISLTILNNQIIVKAGNEVASIVVDTHRNVDHNGLPSHIDFNAIVAAFNRAGTGQFTNPEVVGTL